MQTATLVFLILFLIASAIIAVLLYLLKQNKKAQDALQREMQKRINSEYRLLFESWKKEY